MPIEPMNGGADSPTRAIQAAIHRGMYHPDDPSKMFICENRLSHAWSDHHHVIDIIFPSTSYTIEDKKAIRHHFLRILSILIFMGWSPGKLRSKFRSDLLPAEGRTDHDLPFTGGQLDFLGNEYLIFKEKQFAFIPAIIEESDYSHIQVIQQNIRLPFSGKPDQVGDGAYGHVVKVTLPPRYLFHIIKQTDNTRVRIGNRPTTWLLTLTITTAPRCRLQNLPKREQR